VALTLQPEDLASSDAQALIEALNADLAARYPGESADHEQLTPAQLADGQGMFVVARLNGTAVGCGALRRREQGTGELKRMYVKPAHRGQGIGRQILSNLESAARQMGLARLVLETGELQPEAISLYESSGYRRIPCFGEYAVFECDGSVCMEKVLR
jgi:putative acetyltransferase